MRSEFLPICAENAEKLENELLKNFDLPDGKFFEVKLKEGMYKIALMEESGACTVGDMFIEVVEVDERTEAEAKNEFMEKALLWLKG